MREDEMTCEQRREQILLFAADALDASERDELTQHLRSGCPRCAGSFAEAQAVLASLPLALDPATPSPDVKQRLMQRVQASISTDAPRQPATPFVRPERRVQRWLSPVLAAGLAAAAVYVIV